MGRAQSVRPSSFLAISKQQTAPPDSALSTVWKLGNLEVQPLSKLPGSNFYAIVLKNMTIHENIKQKVQEAMKERNSEKTNTLRGLLSAFTNELVALKMKPQELLPDDKALLVIKREIKKRRESITQFATGNRPDLVASEERELAFIKPYEPVSMSEEEIKKIVLAKKAELNITDKSKAGILTGAVMKELSGRADGSIVAKIIDETF